MSDKPTPAQYQEHRKAINDIGDRIRSENADWPEYRVMESALQEFRQNTLGQTPSSPNPPHEKKWWKE